MCYDIKAQLETQLLRAMRDGDVHAIEEIREKLIPLTDLPLFHSKGFAHPSILIYTDEDPYFPTVSEWGLVPEHAENRSGQKRGLNARGENIFKYDVWKESAKKRRCIIPVDGFYEHHHYDKTPYPFFIRNRDKTPYMLAGLWSTWKDPKTGGIWNTFAVVTTVPNKVMAILHNNPNRNEPRMPLILPPNRVDDWLIPYEEENWLEQKRHLKSLIKPYPHDDMEYFTVGKLSGNAYIGNVPEISELLEYPEFQIDYLAWAS